MAPRVHKTFANDCGCRIPDNELVTIFKKNLVLTFAVVVCFYSLYVNHRIGNGCKQITENFQKNQVAEKYVENAVQKSTAQVQRKLLSAQDIVGKNENLTSLIERAIEKYDADKTGMPDFALESAGGEVVDIGDTKNYAYPTKSVIKKLWNFYYDFFCNQLQEAAEMLRPNVSPGKCWAFAGATGFAVIKLKSYVKVTGMTVEHIPSSISPTNEISSAPRTITLHGLTHPKDSEGFEFGTFEYRAGGPSVQHFAFEKRSEQPFDLIAMNVTSNWGNPMYTCMYRVRIHGQLGSH